MKQDARHIFDFAFRPAFLEIAWKRSEVSLRAKWRQGIFLAEVRFMEPSRGLRLWRRANEHLWRIRQIKRRAREPKANGMRATVFQLRRRFVFKNVEASADAGIEEIRADASRRNGAQ